MTDREITLRRLHMRSIRRGMKEMDLILTRFAEETLPGLDDDGLALYEQMLSENDQDLYIWISGQQPAPEPFTALIAQIAEATRGGLIAS